MEKRDVHELNLTLSVKWLETGDLKIDINITNNEEITTPVIQIRDITSDLRHVNAIISNVGNADATHVFWNITVKGGALGLINTTTEGAIATLAAGEAVAVGTTERTFGLGKVTITVTADTATRNTQGFVLGPFIFIN